MNLEPLSNNQLIALSEHLQTIKKPIVLVGMMGCGKSAIGKIIAQQLDYMFLDADHEIEKAAGQTISEIFNLYGEAFFREREAKVIERLLDSNPAPYILSTGGGAFMTQSTRQHIKKQAISIWLHVNHDLLWSRIQRKRHRPLMAKANPEAILRELSKNRNPTYAKADITVSNPQHIEITKNAMAHQLLHQLADYFRL